MVNISVVFSNTIKTRHLNNYSSRGTKSWVKFWPEKSYREVIPDYKFKKIVSVIKQHSILIREQLGYSECIECRFTFGQNNIKSVQIKEYFPNILLFATVFFVSFFDWPDFTSSVMTTEQTANDFWPKQNIL